MATELNLAGGREPAQMPAGGRVGHHESGLGQVVFGGDGLQARIGQPVVQNINSRGVSGESDLGKRIDLMIGQAGDW